MFKKILSVLTVMRFNQIKRPSTPFIFKGLLVMLISFISMELLDQHITLANEFKISAVYGLAHCLTLALTRIHIIWYLLFWFAGYGTWLLL